MINCAWSSAGLKMGVEPTLRERAAMLRDMLCPDGLSVCFLSFPSTHNQEIKGNDRRDGKKEREGKVLGSNYKRLAERFSCTSSRHSSLRCWLAAQRCEWHHTHMFDSQWLAGERYKGWGTCWIVGDELILVICFLKKKTFKSTVQSQAKRHVIQNTCTQSAQN